MTTTAAGTHEQRRKSQRLKNQWLEDLKSGRRSLVDLVASAQGDGDEARYLGSMLLVDLVSAAHPGLSRAQVIAELEPLPIKLPADPARFSIRTIRSRPDIVEIVAELMTPSAATASARARTDVPSGWPWGAKLSDLVRINGGQVPAELEWLEAGEGSRDDDVSDVLLSGPEVRPTLATAAEPADQQASAAAQAHADPAEAASEDAAEADVPPGDDDPLQLAFGSLLDTLDGPEQDQHADAAPAAETSAQRDPREEAFGDILGDL